MEKLLAFYFDDTEYRKLRRAARSLHIPCEAVDAADYSQTLESLAPPYHHTTAGFPTNAFF